MSIAKAVNAVKPEFSVYTSIYSKGYSHVTWNGCCNSILFGDRECPLQVLKTIRCKLVNIYINDLKKSALFMYGSQAPW